MIQSHQIHKSPQITEQERIKAEVKVFVENLDAENRWPITNVINMLCKHLRKRTCCVTISASITY